MYKIKNKRQGGSFFWTICLLGVLLILWQVGVSWEKIDPFFFSSPQLVWEDLLDIIKNGTLAKHSLATLQESALGLLWGGLFGTLAAFVFGLCPRINRLLMPLMVGLNGLPKIAFAPMFIVWFGIGLKTKVVVSACMVFFIFLFNMYSGYANVSVDLVNAVKMLGGNRWQVVKKVIWPSCIPWFFASLRTGLGMAVTGAIVGEFIGSSKGLGYQILDAAGTYNMARVLSCIFVLIVAMGAMDYLLKLLENIVLKWRPEND